MAAGFAIIIGLFIYRDMKITEIPSVIRECVPRVGMIFWITTNALLFGYFITKIGLPAALAKLVLDLNLSPVVFLFCVNILLIIVGFFLEGVPTILIFAPLLVPHCRITRHKPGALCNHNGRQY